MGIASQRMYEGQRDQLANQQFNIDQTSFAIETVQAAKQTVTTMAAASKALKKENKKINLNELEDMQDEMEGRKVLVSSRRGSRVERG